MSVRELILASAGSGKTFRVSSRIIGLLAAGEPPSTILTSTFTRKAAGEILDRVLVRMARASLDEDEAAELARHATLPGGEPPPASSDFWATVLQGTVRELHRLEIATLDSVFVRIVRGFALELGLPPGWGIADEPTAERLRSEALDEVLAEQDRAAILEVLRGLHRGSVKRSVHGTVVRDIAAILEVHQDVDPEALGWSAMREVVGPPPGDLAERAVAAAEAIEAAAVPPTKSGDPSKRWITARDRAAEQVRARAWADYVDAGLYGKVLDAPDGEAPTYYRKPIPAPLVAALERAGALARSALGDELARRAEAMGRLAGAYEESFGRHLLATGHLRFDDVTRLLAGGSAVGGRPDLAYRMDGAARHLLLDEFQDTSLLQWRALLPLADGMVAEPDTGNAAVVVADPKQSIYGWRGAAPVVVDALADRYDLPEDRMERSWRSSPVVLDAVNRVFGGLASAPVTAEEHAEATADWLDAFGEHEAEHRDRPGYVLLEAGPPPADAKDLQPELCRYAAEHIREIVARSPGRSVGVLTRKNATVARMIFELGALGVAASEEGGTRLTDSASVVAVLALLRMVDHPGDGLARYHVAASPVGTAVGLTARGDRARAEHVAQRLRRRLLEEGYGATLGGLARELREACDAREWARLRQLVEVGYRYESGSPPGLRVDEFVRLAVAERAEAPGEAPVRVMTVHRAKGLEFDVVVLPDLHPSMFGGGGGSSPLAYRPAPSGPVTHAFPYVPSGPRKLFEGIEELQEAVRQKAAAEVRDALGGLYVAMTRARYALHMIVPADRDSGPSRSRSAARLLRETLSDLPEGSAVVEGTVLHESGDPAWSEEVGEPARKRQAPPASVPDRIELRTGGPRTRVLDRRTPSGEEGGGATRDLGLLLGLGGKGGRERGVLVHAWLETLEWVEDGLPPGEELLRIARGALGAVDPETVERHRAWLADRLRAPAVRELLSRRSWPDDATVELELPFVRREGDALVEGVIDRLVLVHEAGRVVRATVIDYKTDRIEPGGTNGIDAAPAELVEHYRPQIHAYRRAVAGLYGLELDDVEGRLVFLDAAEVRPVG